MVNKTFSKILTLGLATVLVTSVLCTFVFYKNYDIQAKQSLKDTAQVLALHIQDEDYVEINKSDYDGIRITVIDRDGNVLADNKEDYKKMDSHFDRPEFKEALENGEGYDVRKSTTLDESTYYYAVKLSNGDVMRISTSYDSAFYAFYKSLYIIAVVMLAVMLISLALSFVITKSIVKPVVELGENIDDIENVQTYSELQPFVETVKLQNKRKKLLEKQKKEFTANVSHELKTPLTAIAGYAELIENGMAKQDDIKPFAQTIRKQALRLVALTEDIMQLSQLDEIEDYTYDERVELSKIVELCVSSLQLNAQSKNVTLVNKCNECWVKGNSSLLEEMIYNLIDNAIRYNKENGSVTVFTNQSDNKSSIIVEDTGIGIAEKYQKRVFERFFRVDKSRSKATGGTGLGLAIVKHIAQTHNAEIKLNSVENVGTTIEIKFNRVD